MQIEGFVILGVIIIAIVLLFIAIKRKSVIIINFVLRGVLGTIAIYLINQTLLWQGMQFSIGINPLTVLTSAGLGFPGILLLYGIKIYSVL